LGPTGQTLAAMRDAGQSIFFILFKKTGYSFDFLFFHINLKFILRMSLVTAMLEAIA
jgi:hypothetical protein